MTTSPIVKAVLQMDSELLYIFEETYREIWKDKDSVRRINLCKAIGEAIGATLIERAGEAAASRNIDISEFPVVAADSLYGMGEEVISKGARAIARVAAETCVMFMQCRLLGMKSPYFNPRSRHDNYNPFGNEGGFCNPMKLKMMDD